MFNKSSKIYVAGHTGLLGSAFVRVLTKRGYKNIITKTHKKLDLTDKSEVENFFKTNNIDYIFLCAGKVGGIMANKRYPASFLYENVMIQSNIFEMANRYSVKNVVFYGSSCTYPKKCKQPIKEEYLLAGALEETSLGYAAAKISGIVGCRSYNIQYSTDRFISVIPNSIYGINDNFDLENSHVLSALIRKIDTAKQEKKDELTLWGSGKPKREFIFSDDVVDASIFLVKNIRKLENTHYNLGASRDYSIKELAKIVSDIVGYRGKIKWDKSKPDGALIKRLDSSKIESLGWKPKVNFEKGLRSTYEWYRSQK